MWNSLCCKNKLTDLYVSISIYFRNIAICLFGTKYRNIHAL